jgi:hypothetical protein
LRKSSSQDPTFNHLNIKDYAPNSPKQLVQVKKTKMRGVKIEVAQAAVVTGAKK